MRAEELEAVLALWIATKRDAYPYLPLEQQYSEAENRAFLRDHIATRCALFVAVEQGERERGEGPPGEGEEKERASEAEIRGFLAIEGSYVDRLYVHPAAQRRGIGAALLADTKQRHPDGLSLHTHQKNTQARAFYEKHGFTVFRFGISPPPESEPDVEYRWRPA